MFEHARRNVASSALAACVACCSGAFAALPQDAAIVDRTSLPIAEPDHPHSTVLDARDAQAPPRFELAAPKSAE